MNDIENMQHHFYFFIAAGRKWGVDIAAIREVSELTDILCPVPHAQYAIMGYLNVRGEIHQIISFKSLILGKKADEAEKGLILFFKDSIGQAFGIYVDDACEIIGIDSSSIEHWETASTKGSSEFDMSDYLTCDIFRDANELIPLIDPKRIPDAININEIS